MLHVSNNNKTFLPKLREDRSNFQEKRCEKNFPFVPLHIGIKTILKWQLFFSSTVKLGDKEQIGVKEPFPLTNCQFTS